MTGFLALNPKESSLLSGIECDAESFHPVMTGCKVGPGETTVELAAERLHFDSEYAHSESCRSDKNI
jgi:hypothetical protein